MIETEETGIFAGTLEPAETGNQGMPAENNNDDVQESASAPTNEQPSEGEQSQGAVPSPEKVFYTPEEMKALAPEKIDTSRIPPEMQAFYKAMQSGWNKKFQSLADEKKQFEQSKNEAERPQELFESYLENPRGVMNFLNREIEKLTSLDQYDEGYNDAQRQIKQLESLKDDLRERREVHINSNARSREITSKVKNEVFQKVAGFEAKAPLISEFLVNKGFSPQELSILSNPLTTVQTDRGSIPLGSLASKFIIFANEFYDMANAGQSAEQKIVKPNPPALERGGSGTERKAKEKSTSEIFYGS